MGIANDRRALIVIVGLVSGACWGLMAWTLGNAVAGGKPHYFRGGLLGSPLIGLAAAFLSSRFPSHFPGRVAFALVSLYASAALFGLSIGVFNLLFDRTSVKTIEGLLFEPVMAVLWGLTFMGFFIVFWPLAFANHLLVARLWRRTI